MAYFKNIVTWCLLNFSVVCFAGGDQVVVETSHELFNEASNHILANPDLSPVGREKLNNVKAKVSASKNTAFTEEELVSAMSVVIDDFGAQITPEMRKAAATAQEALLKRLRSFKVTGFAFAVDPNGAFIVDMQDPAFDVVFKNDAGEIKRRRFQADIKSIGLKLQVSINLNFIFFVDTDLDYLTSCERIELGVGGEISSGWLYAIWSIITKGYGDSLLQFGGVNLTYIPFKKISGSLFIVSLCLGFPGNSLSVVTGGSLTPLV